MSFTSYGYLLFLAVAAGLVALARGRTREYVLLAASLVYYAAWDPRFLVVLLALGAFTYWAGNHVAERRGRLSALLVPVAVILLVLVVFKYTGMLAVLANLMLPRGLQLSIPEIVLPLGISFYTFECISYVIDIYQGGQPLKPLHRFLLFPSLWPHMVAGPILRLKEFAPQLERPPRITSADVILAVDRILIGLFKKVVLANQLAPFVDQAFAPAATANSALDNWAVTIAFALQIYFDFSAYTDIAIGSARLIGFTFPENFNLPYHARSPTDFWNRWHMSLSRWIRDYLFFPLNLKAGRRIWLRYLSLVLVMAAVGLWHGAGLGFVLWGVWHGCLLVAHRVIEPRARALPDAWRLPWGLAGRLATVTFVVAGWVPFRATSIEQAGRMLTSMFTLRGLTPSYSVNDYLLVLFCGLEYWLLEPLFKRVADARPESLSFDLRLWARPIAYAAAIDLVFMFDQSNVAFIYFQF